MKRLKHRCNSQEAIDRALADGYDGVEVDLIWGGPGGENNAEIVLGHCHHDTGPNVFDIDFHGCVVAFNVKEYGMYPLLSELASTTGDWFVFDVPGPELLEYLWAGIPYFGRVSEVETQESPHGIVVDSFFGGAGASFQAVLTDSRRKALISNTLRSRAEYAPQILTKVDYLITK